MCLGIEIFWLNPDFIPQMRRKVTRKDTVLAKSSLFRFDEGRDTEARLQKVLSYNYEKSEYYGQVPGMIRALPTQVWPLTQAFSVFYKFLNTRNMKYKGILFRPVLILRVIFCPFSVLMTLSWPLALLYLSTWDP